MSDLVKAETSVVICGDQLSRCRCGLPPGHESTVHECAEGDPQCGGAWISDPDDEHRVFVVRYPGLREGGPNVGRGFSDPIEPEPTERGTRPRPQIRFMPAPDLSEIMKGIR